nr:MBL fold metallo-hydrolase [Bradyrhizobium brasilense]
MPGYGVTFKLVEAGLRLPLLRHIFITHHHSDHNLELGPLLYNAWAAGLRTPIDVYAPTGLVVPLQLAVRCYGLTNESSWRSALC